MPSPAIPGTTLLTEQHERAPEATPRSASNRRTGFTIALWATLLVVSRLWGDSIIRSGRVIRLNAPPLVGWDDVRFNGFVVLPVLVGLAAVAVLPPLCRRLPWRTLLVVATAFAALWGVALALNDGLDGITRPVTLKNDEYLLDVDLVESPGEFLDHYTEDIDRYVNHVRSHPPGTLLGLWALDRVGLGGTGWAAALFIAGGVTAVPAVLVATRLLAGEGTARSALPFVAVAPAAIWVVTTADALFAAVGAWAATAVIVALHRRGRRSDVFALVGGLGFGVLLMLSYALFLVGAVPALVALHRRRLRPLVLAGLGASIVLGVFALAGFSWLDGFLTARGEYRESVARTRPHSYFAVSNLAAFAIAIGPALVVALTRVRDRMLWLVVGGALGAVVVANASGLSKGEVERIWLPFTVWVLAAGATLAGGGEARSTRRWLALQVAFAIAVQVLIRSRW
ncbi:MAG: hypothetical protein H0U26_03455 [Acidimicrobiia bacterium]|nr:hypothetical protein [Acidimicrobiia bacterium]